nr:MAG TPA: Nuclear polyadenylated RNA-binding 2 protein CCCH zinc finger 1 [Bacteriophage sp.]
MAVPGDLPNFVFHGRCKAFPYCQMSILFRDTVSETSSPSFIS